MSTIVLQSVVNRALTSTEIDANFTALNTDKVETTAPVFSGLVTLPSQSIALTESNLPDVAPTLNLDFANSKQLDSRITFGRGSGGAYYDGKTTAKAEENLFFRSQEFDNQTSWIRNTSPIIGDTQVAPDGTTTADTVTTSVSDGNGFLRQTIPTVSGNIYTISIYLKYVDSQWVRVRIVSAATGNPSVWFDIQNGVVGGINAPLTASNPINVGNGWFRCVVTFTAISSGDFRLAPSDGNNVATQTTNTGFYAWGAQLEQRSSVTAYTPTTTSPITNYIPVLLQAPLNTPRFDHDSRPTFNGTCTVSGSAVTLPTTFADGSSPSTINKFYTGSITISGTAYVITNYVGSTRVVTVTGTPTAGAFSLANKNYGQSLGLLIEESRTNLFTYSSDFRNTADAGSTRPWLYTSISLTPNTVIAPDGTLSGSKLYCTTSSGQHRIDFSDTAGAGTLTLTVYAKAAEFNFLGLGSAQFGGQITSFNLTNGTYDKTVLGGSLLSASMVAVGNGWYKCSVTGTTLGYKSISVFNTQNNFSYTGDGYSGIYIWGAQLEQGSFATSYIPTPSNATVTRQPDIASMTGTNFSSWYNQSEGTMYAEINPLLIGSVQRANTSVYSLNRNGDFSGQNITLRANTLTDFRPTITDGSTYTETLTYIQVTPSNALKTTKIALAYNGSAFTGLANGGTVNTFTVNHILSNISYLIIGGGIINSGSAYALCGHIRKLTYYPKALSAPQLQGLTK